MSVAILLLFLVNFVRLLHGKSRNNLDKMLNAYLSNLSLWVSHDGQMGVTTTLAPKDLGPHNRIKTFLRYRWTFWVNFYIEIKFWKFSGLNPLPTPL